MNSKITFRAYALRQREGPTLDYVTACVEF